MGFNHPDYTIIRELGYGASGVVYLAVQNQLNRRVAVKVFNDPVSIQSGRRGNAHGVHSGADRRFLREARILAQLDHPHIVPVYELSPMPEQQGYLLAMAYIEGGTLRQRAADFSLRQALQVIEQIASALSYAHQSGFVHRDVKPDNILFQNSQAMLADFGIARAADSETKMTQHGALLGTPEYMSPEQVNGHEVDGRSDLYSLGIVFYELLTGSTPFKSDSAIATGIQHLTADARRLPAAFSVYQPLMDRLLAKDKDSRHASASELIAELQHATANIRWSLDDALSELRTNAAEYAITADTESPVRRSALPTPARGLAAVIVVVAIVLWLLRGALNNTSQSPTDVIALAPEDAVPNSSAEEQVASVSALVKPGSQSIDASTDLAQSDSRPDIGPEIDVDINPGSRISTGEEQTDVMDPLADQVESALELWMQNNWFDSEPNAVTELVKVQELDPDRREVNNALDDIFERTYRLAEESLAQGEPDQATAELARLQRYWPGDSRLVPLQQRIQAAEKKQRQDRQREQQQLAKQRQLAQERQRRIQGFLASAEGAEQNGSLFEPERGSAYYYYQQILKEDANNSSVINALAGLKRRELSQISSLSERSQFDAAEARLAVLDRFYPEDADVAGASQKLQQQKQQYAQQLEVRRRQQALEAEVSELKLAVEQWLGDTSVTALSSQRSFESRISDLRAQSPQNPTLDRLELTVKQHAKWLQDKRASEAAQQVDDTFNMPGF